MIPPTSKVAVATQPGMRNIRPMLASPPAVLHMRGCQVAEVSPGKGSLQGQKCTRKHVHLVAISVATAAQAYVTNPASAFSRGCDER